MKATIRKFGNSRGLIIPKPILEQTGLSENVELVVDDGIILIRNQANEKPRAGWAQASARLAEQEADELIWPEFSNDEDQSLEW